MVIVPAKIDYRKRKNSSPGRILERRSAVRQADPQISTCNAGPLGLGTTVGRCPWVNKTGLEVRMKLFFIIHVFGVWGP